MAVGARALADAGVGRGEWETKMQILEEGVVVG
jgi:hypothetical protein